MGKLGISNEEFVVAWQQARDVREVCARLGVDYKKHRITIMVRAHNLRNHGVELKSFGRGSKIDWAALNKLARKNLPEKK